MAINDKKRPEQEQEQQEPQQGEQLSQGALDLAAQIRQQMGGGMDPMAAQQQGMPPQAMPQQMPPQDTMMPPQEEPADFLKLGEQQGAQDTASVFKARMSKERLDKAMTTLMRYKSGKSHLETRIITDEQWWKLRHWDYMQETGNPNDMRTSSAWLFNVIISKHADGIQSTPEANILPREEQDQETAHTLSGIIPCVLEENRFDEVYSDVLWQKLKTGTGAYGVFWDGQKLNGMGDISIKKVNLLHLFWEPGISDIQDSANVYYVEAVDIDRLKAMYPDKIGENDLMSKAATVRKFITEDPINDDHKAVVVDWYYHQYENGRNVLHYTKFVGDVVLYSTEDDPELGKRGLYDHAMYPFVLDTLFPVEGSPCGFGYIDVCKGAQEQIDVLSQALIKNALINAIPRYFVRSDGSVNEEEFMDFTKPIVHCTGNLGSDSVVGIQPTALNANVVTIINNKIQELKETSGNTDSSNGVGGAGQAASAIAALQEASGKVSRASSASAYRAFQRIVNMLIELIRQFYDMPRQFRITGENGQTEFATFDNGGLVPQSQGVDFGYDMGYRLPVFDVKVSAQTKSAYTKNSQNELAMNLYASGVFNPQMTDQSLMLLDMMDFEGKDDLRAKISQMGTLQQQLAQMSQIALSLAQTYEPQLAEQIAAMVMTGAAEQGAAAQISQGAPMQKLNDGGNGGAMTKLNKARARAQQTAQMD